jgi:hypothetical protein
MSLRPPETLNNDHVVTDFSCGIVSLDHWLKQKALVNQASGATRTFVVCIDDQVVGYLTLGFNVSPLEPLTLMITLNRVVAK